MASFSVVVIAKEDQSVIEFFARHYLAAGAQKIYLHYDGTAPFAFNAPDQRVEFVECDEQFWRDQGMVRPDDFNDLQRWIYRAALARCHSDWLLVVDCDEMLYSARPIGQILDTIPPAHDVVRVPNVEAVWRPQDDRTRDFSTRLFRRFARNHLQRALLKLIYRGKWRYLKHGLAGHSAGKQFIRSTAQGLELGIHTSRSISKGPARWLDQIVKDEVLICHFDALSSTRWKQKMIDRMHRSAGAMNMPDQRHRLVALAAKQAHDDPGGLDKTFERFYTLGPIERAIMSVTNMQVRRDFTVHTPDCCTAAQSGWNRLARYGMMARRRVFAHNLEKSS